MTWQDVPGWFDFAEIYDLAVSEAKDWDVFVEVGSFVGKSSCYLAQKIRESGKRIVFFCIDQWDLEDWVGVTTKYQSIPPVSEKDLKRSMYAAFLNYLSECRIGNVVKPLKMSCQEAAAKLKPSSVKFVFLDLWADAPYERVKADIEAWLPKITPGGIIAGHDYEPRWEGLVKAVDEVLGKPEVRGISWMVRR